MFSHFPHPGLQKTGAHEPTIPTPRENHRPRRVTSKHTAESLSCIEASFCKRGKTRGRIRPRYIDQGTVAHEEGGRYWDPKAQQYIDQSLLFQDFTQD
jgi:hypothetical protein